MADTSYHIYLHGMDGGTSTKPSTAKTTQTKPQDSEEGFDAVGTIKSVYSNVSNVMNSGASSYISQGIAALSKVAPWVAIAVAVVKTADTVVSTGFGHLETYTGDYQYAMGYNNIKTALGNIINPVGLIKYQWNRQAQFNLQNQRIEQARTLIGNSSLSTYKIGV